MLTTVHPAFDNRIFHKEAKSLAKSHDVVMIAPNEEVIVSEEMKRVSNGKIIIIHGGKHPLLLFNQKRSQYHYFTGKELKRLLEKIGLEDVGIYYVTHSVPLLFNLFGEMKLKKIENIIQNIPLIKMLGGSIIACGKKT